MKVEDEELGNDKNAPLPGNGDQDADDGGGKKTPDVVPNEANIGSISNERPEVPLNLGVAHADGRAESANINEREVDGFSSRQRAASGHGNTEQQSSNCSNRKNDAQLGKDGKQTVGSEGKREAGAPIHSRNQRKGEKKRAADVLPADGGPSKKSKGGGDHNMANVVLVEVIGSGIPEANGTYVRDGVWSDGVPYFCKTVYVNGKRDFFQLHYRRSKRMKTGRWYISVYRKGYDSNLFMCEVPDCMDLKPVGKDWVSVGKGVAPPSRLETKDYGVPPSLAKWPMISKRMIKKVGRTVLNILVSNKEGALLFRRDKIIFSLLVVVWQS